MVFNSIPQFPWPSSRTPHPTERDDFCIFTSNCPIWKKMSAKTAKSIHSPIHPYHQHKQINLQPDESLQDTPKKTHFTRHVTTTLSMLEAGNGLFLSHKPLCWRIVDCHALQTARVQEMQNKTGTNPFFGLFLVCVMSKPFLKNVGMVYDDLNQPINVHLRKKSGKFFTT